MFGRSNSSSTPPPRKPKIGKIPLPDLDTLRPASRPSLSPSRPMNTSTPGPSAARELDIPKPRLIRAHVAESSTSGYFSEPEGRSSRPTPRNPHVTLVPMKQEDGPSRQIGGTRASIIPESPVPRRGMSSGRTPKPSAVPLAPSLNERTYSRTTGTNPPAATPLVRPSAMKKKPSESTTGWPQSSCASVAKKDVLSPIPIRSRTFSYSSAIPEPRPTKTVNFAPTPIPEVIPNIHWQLLPFELFKSKHCLHFDVSLPPANISACGRIIKQEQLEKPAASPKLTEMIIQGDLRWKIVVKKSSGITCEDVFQAIYDTYDIPLTEKDRAEIDPKFLQRCERAFKRRCEAVPRLSEREKRIGMKRVDLLDRRTFFYGLTKADTDSPWKLELKAMPPCGRVLP